MNRLNPFFLVQILGLALVLSACPPCQSQTIRLDSPGVVLPGPWKIHSGDDSIWADPTFDDSGWETVGNDRFQQKERGIFWYRTRIDLRGISEGTSPLGIGFYNLPMAYEVYWDGKLVGSNGTVGGDQHSERPGRTRVMIGFNPTLTQSGTHLLGIRLSTMHWVNHNLLFGVALGRVDVLQANIQDSINRSLFFMGLYATVFLVCIALFLGGWRTPSFFLLGLYTLLGTLLQAWHYGLYQGHFTTSLYQWVESFFLYGTILEDGLLAAFVLWHFGFRKPARHLLILLAAAAVLQGTSAWLGLYRSLDFSRILITGYAVILAVSGSKRKAPGGWLVMAGLAVKFFTVIYFILRGNATELMVLRIGNGFVLSCLVAAVMMKIVQQHRQLQILSVQAKELETEVRKQSSTPSHLVYRFKNEKHLLPISQVLYFEAERVIVEAHVENGNVILLEKPLNQLEKELPNRFLRIHRSFIVNLDHVQSYRHAGGSTYQVRLKQGHILPVSRSHIKILQNRLGS